VTSEEFPYYIVLNNGLSPALLTMNMGTRQTIVLRSLKYPQVCLHLNLFVPDVPVTDANDLLVLMADGRVIYNHQPKYTTFLKSSQILEDLEASDECQVNNVENVHVSIKKNTRRKIGAKNEK
jgi:hypothetical protein